MKLPKTEVLVMYQVGSVCAFITWLLTLDDDTESTMFVKIGFVFMQIIISGIVITRDYIRKRELKKLLRGDDD